MALTAGLSFTYLAMGYRAQLFGHVPVQALGGSARWWCDPWALAQWLRGGQPPPAYPVHAQDSWTTTGAQVYPQRPLVVGTAVYEEWVGANDVVYVATGEDAVRGVMPVGVGGTYCGEVVAV